MALSVPKEQLKDYIGTELEPSDWFTIAQDRINMFADATEDHQFIHVDEQKAAETPFGGTIAHGYLSLSLVPHLSMLNAIVPDNLAMAINYGLNKVRFLNPVKVNSEVRAHTKVVDVSEKSPGQILVTNQVTIEIKGEDKPAMIAETLALYFVQ